MAGDEAIAPKQPVLLLIHGTFATASHQDPETPSAPLPSCKRLGWWEPGSSFWTSLQQALRPPGIVLAGDASALSPSPGSLDAEGDLPAHLRPFRWSSANTERARHQAAQQLLQRLLVFEEEGRDYHLIGHSHGGSVIWLALQKAVLFRWRQGGPLSQLYQLRHLRSWCTIGTAFLHYQGIKVGIWYGKALTILSLLLCFGFGIWVAQMRFPDWQKENRSVSESIARFATNRAPLSGSSPIAEAQPPFQQAGQEIQRTAAGLSAALHAGSRVTAGEWAKAASQALGLLLLVSAPFLTIYLWLHALRTEARNVYREQRAKNQAMLEFGDRWLGLCSSEDEAISGLRATTRLTRCQIIPRLSIPTEKVFESDRIIRFWKPFVRLLIAPLYNRLFGPSADFFVLNRLTRAAQGNNRIGCALVDVSETPVPLEGFRGANLPRRVDEELITRANAALSRRSEHVLASTRTGLSQFAWGSSSFTTMVQDVQSHLSGEDLVHTSYFQDSAVRELLSLHLQKCQDAPPSPPSPCRHPLPPIRAPRGVPSALRAAGWLFLASLFIFSTAAESVAGYPSLTLMTALLLTGLFTAISPLRRQEAFPSPVSVWAAVATGGAIAASGLWIAWAPRLLPDVSSPDFIPPGLNRAFVAAALLLSTSVCFVASLTNTQRNPLLAHLSGWLGFAILLALAGLGNWLLAGWFHHPTGFLLIFLAILFGLYQAFSPLRNAPDVFCLPALGDSAASPPSPSSPSDDWEDDFRRSVRDRVRTGDESSDLRAWLEHFRQSVRERLEHDESLTAYALPRLGDPNHLALAVLLLLGGGLAGGLLVPLLLSTALPHPNPALTGAAAACASLAILLSFLLSFASAVRATRGARRGWMARLCLEFFSFVFLSGIASLLCLSVHQALFQPPTFPIRENLIWPAPASPLIICVDQHRLHSMNHENGQQAAIPDLDGATWDFVAAGSRLPGQPVQWASVRKQRICLWTETATGVWQPRHLAPAPTAIAALAFSETEDAWVSASVGGDVIVWDARRGREAASLPRASAPIRALAVHPRHPELALALQDRSIRLWNWEENLQLATLRELPHPVCELAYLPGTEDLLALDETGTLRRFRASPNRSLLQRARLPAWCPQPAPAALLPADPSSPEPASSTRVEAFAIPPSNTGNSLLVLACREADNRTQLLGGSPSGKEAAFRLTNLPGPITALAFSPDGSSLIAKTKQSRSQTIQIFDVAQSKIRGTWARIGQIPAVSFHPDGHTLAAGLWGQIALWDPQTGELRRTLPGHQGTVSSIQFSPDGQHLASGSYDNTVKIWSLAQNGAPLTLRGHADWVTAVAFSPAGKGILASASHDRSLKIWDLSTGLEKFSLRGHSHWVTGLAFHPSGDFLASSSRDGTVKIWEIATGKELASLTGRSQPVSCVAFSPDGRTLASACHNGVIRLWDASSREPQAMLREQDGAVTSLAFSPDSLTLTSTTCGGSISFWDLRHHRLQASHRLHAQAARCAAYSPDGRLLASSSEEGTVHLWHQDENRLVQTIGPWICQPAP